MTTRSSGLSPHLDYIVPVSGTTSVPRPQAREPNDEVRKRFNSMLAQVLDTEGRLRPEHRPTAKPQPLKEPATSLFTIDMDSNSGRLPPFVS